MLKQGIEHGLERQHQQHAAEGPTGRGDGVFEPGGDWRRTARDNTRHHSDRRQRCEACAHAKRVRPLSAVHDGHRPDECHQTRCSDDAGAGAQHDQATRGDKHEPQGLTEPQRQPGVHREARCEEDGRQHGPGGNIGRGPMGNQDQRAGQQHEDTVLQRPRPPAVVSRGGPGQSAKCKDERTHAGMIRAPTVYTQERRRSTLAPRPPCGCESAPG